TGTPDCNNIQLTSGTGNLKLSGLIAPVVSVQIFNNGWATVFNQTYTNSPGNLTISTLPAGTYHVKVSFRTATWAAICEKMQDGVISQGTSSLQTDYANESGLDRVYESTGRVITVAPNPFVSSVYVTIGSDKNENGSITIMDIAGRVIVKRSVTLQRGLSRFTIDGLSQLRQGSYVLRLTTTEGVQNIRLIKQ
ncbi:MAG TPA: T9SS type A sorting domain-containing protein, partial [Chitinophagaceae bacterium]|nr:T9SS type A sorting domain-containing protein [Chitinophagaceae bacterium]